MPHLSARIREASFHRWFTTVLHPPPKGTLWLTEREYEYEHQLPRAQEDPVYLMILMTLRQIEKDDIGLAAARIRVWNTTTSPPIWPPKPRNPDSKFYTFKEWYQEFPITVPVTIAQGVECKLTFDDLRVLYQGRLVSLRTWLLELPDRQMLLSKRHGIESQRIWWRKNRKVFRLFDLPTELRILIYRHMIGPIYPTTAPSSSLGLTQQPRLIISDRPKRKTPRKYFNSRMPQGDNMVVSPRTGPDLSILRVSSRIYDEVLEAVWENTRKHFVEADMFTNVVSARDGPGPASNYNCLSHIQLDFTVYQYFDFFGVDWMSLGQNVHNADCRNLELLPQLKDLQLRFRYPPEHYDSAQWDGGNGCQQRCIDWLLTFAFPVLAGLKVTFVGGITAGTKKKWEKRLKQKLEGKPESFDFEGELDKIFSIAEQGQVRICSTWCSCSGTSTDDSSQGKGESGTGDDSSPE